MGRLMDMALALSCDMESTAVPPKERRAIAAALAVKSRYRLDAEPMPAYMIIYRRTQAIRMHKELTA